MDRHEISWWVDRTLWALFIGWIAGIVVAATWRFVLWPFVVLHFVICRFW